MDQIHNSLKVFIETLWTTLAECPSTTPGDVYFLSVLRNFEESDDELREAVADSMKNLFVLEDSSSEERVEEEEEEDGGSATAANCQQIQTEVQDSDVTAGATGLVSSEEGEDNATVTTQKRPDSHKHPAE